MFRLLVLLVLSLVAMAPTLQAAAPKNQTMKIGVFITESSNIYQMINLAVQKINSLDTVLPDFNLTLSSYTQTDEVDSVTSTVVAITQDHVFGMIGDLGSALAIPSALVHSGFKIPHCSGAATSPALSNKALYNYFFRTLPNDNYQGRVMVDFMVKMGWKRFGIVFTTDAYGQGVAYSVLDHANSHKMEVPVMLNVVTTTLDDFSKDNPFDSLMSQIKAADIRIVVIASYDTVEFLRSAERVGILDQNHVFLGFEQSSEPLPEDAYLYNGMLYTQPLSGLGPGYDQFLADFETISPGTPHGAYDTFFHDCLLALAYGYHKLIYESGGAYTPEMLLNDELNDLLNFTLFTTSPFEGASGAEVTFDARGDKLGAYNIFNFRNKGLDRAPVTIVYEGEFFNFVDPVFFNGSTTVPADRAPPKPEFYMAYTEGISIALLLLTAVGFLSAAVFLGVLIYFREAPVFKSSSVVFCVIIMIGCFIGYSAIPLGIGEPTPAKCMAQPWLYAIGFSLVYASLLAKTWRIYRIFDNEKLRIQTITNRDLGIFTSVITALQVVILIAWTASDPMIPTRDFTSDPDFTLVVCSSANKTLRDGFGWALLAVNATMVLAAAFLAFKTRHVSTKFKESKYIGMSVYNVILVLLVIVPIVAIDGAASYQIQILLRGLGVFLISSFVLFILFAPKLLAIINKSTGDTSQDSSSKPSGPNNMLSYSEKEKRKVSQNLSLSQSQGAADSPSILLSSLNPKDLQEQV